MTTEQKNKEIKLYPTKVIRESYRAFRAGFRVIVNQGGTRSGKTYSMVQLLFLIANAGVFNIDVVSESMPHLKRGALNDFQENLDNRGLIEGEHYEHNRTDSFYTFPNGSKVTFFSADDWGKVKGSRRDVLFINECNRINYEVYRQLAVRTTKCIFLDYNPDSEFWLQTKNIQCKDTTKVIISTYKDNPFLPKVQIEEIESNKGDAEWWKVYGLGLMGTHKGLIYKNWDIVKDIPANANLLGYGLDFGYQNDKTAIVAAYMFQGELYLKQHCYQTGLTNDRIAEILKGLPPSTTIADCAEMKSIDEIKAFGVRNVRPCVKGKDSVNNGIQILQRYKMHVVQDSLDLIYELRNYKWMEDKTTGETLNVPNKAMHVDHALDALRYLASAMLVQHRSGTAHARITRRKF